MRWKRPLFALAALLLFFGLLEAILWAAGVSPLLVERDPFHGFSGAIRVFEPEAETYRTVRRATAHSFNYQQFEGVKPRNGFRFFVLGGSSAYGFPWGADVAFTRVLGRALASTFPERRIEAINAAAMSYGSHRLRILAAELVGYQPDLLVVYGGHNEFVERRFYRDLLDRPHELDAFRGLLARWRLYSALTRSYEKTRATRDAHGDDEARDVGELLGFDVVREYSVDVGETERQEVRTLFEENLRAIVEQARRAGARVVLCTVPSNLGGWVPNRSSFGVALSVRDRKQVQAAIERARAAIENGDPRAAIDALEPAAALDPGYAETHFMLGRAYEALERWDDARASYVLARDLDGRPSRAPSLLNEAIRGVAAEGGALLVDVERAFEQASPHGITGFNLFEDYVHPKPEGHRLIALALWQALVEHGLVGPPREADASVFWAALGRPDGADARVDPSAPTAATEAKTPALLYNLAIVLENQGRFDDAMEKYRACIELDPGYYVARANLARLLSKAGRHAEAAAEYRGALTVDPRHVSSLIGLGGALLASGKPDEARQVLERATRVDPGSPNAWDALGGAMARQNLHADAETAYRRAVELDPENADALSNLGFSLLFQGELDQAKTMFESGLAAARDHLRCRNGLAAVLTERGQLDEAERLFRENLRLDPDDEFALGGLAVVEARRAGTR